MYEKLYQNIDKIYNIENKLNLSENPVSFIDLSFHIIFLVYKCY